MNKKEEKEILREIEKGNFQSANGLKSLKSLYVAYAKNTLKKDNRINISERDLLSI